MARQYMPKVVHGPHKYPPGPPPTYLMYGPLKQKLISEHVIIINDNDYSNPYNERNYDKTKIKE